MDIEVTVYFIDPAIYAGNWIKYLLLTAKAAIGTVDHALFGRAVVELGLRRHWLP